MRELTTDRLTKYMGELAAFEPSSAPFISLYLNAQPDQHGHDNFQPFVRKEFADRLRSFPENSSERASVVRIMRRIDNYLRTELRPSANGVAIFASTSPREYFEAMQFDVPIQRNRLHISALPHLYPLARLIDQNPLYAALVADTHTARLFVFDAGQIRDRETLTSKEVGRALDGEYSDERYRRRSDNQRQLHAKEIVGMLERIVRDEDLERIILGGDEVIIPLIRERLPVDLRERVIDVLPLDIRTPEHDIFLRTMKALRQDDLQADAMRVRELLDEHRAGGSATVGASETLAALSNGQVDELLLSASSGAIRNDGARHSVAVSSMIATQPSSVNVVAIAHETGTMDADTNDIADGLVRAAQRTGSRITFIEDRALLEPIGGVGAFLRYRY
jgi:peptide subunit release factor 1 (eRF1)